MRLKQLQMKNFKRFADLTIDQIPASAKSVVIVGPNGSGKSCVFDAFEQIGGQRKDGLIREDDYLRKDPANPWHVIIEDQDGRRYAENSVPVTSTPFCYIRSSYRYTAQISVNQLQTLPSTERDHDRPKRMIDLDPRLTTNYQRIFTSSMQELFSGKVDNLLGKDIREKYTQRINSILRRILEIQISDIGEPLGGRAQLYFAKGTSKDFAFKNLASGEKEVVDLVVDLVLKTQTFTDTVYCVDEPDLHLNTRIQGALFNELHGLIPERCQLWIATHSIGIIRSAVAHGDVAVINFTAADFDNPVTLRPIEERKSQFREIFSVALEDLTDLVLSEQIVFCEGEDSSRDERLFRNIFQNKVDVEFVSSTNKPMTRVATARFMAAVSRGLTPKRAWALVDMDGLTSEERAQLVSPALCILNRYSLENYVLDPEVISVISDRQFDTDEYRKYLTGKVHENLESLKEKIRESRARDSVTRKCIENHPILTGTIPVNDTNFLDWWPSIPGKKMVGFVGDWIKTGSRSSSITGEDGVDKLLDLASQRIMPGMHVYDELEECSFPK